jgi:hypothetical protein
MNKYNKAKLRFLQEIDNKLLNRNQKQEATPHQIVQPP